MAWWLENFALQSLGPESVFQQPHNKSELLRDAYNPTTEGGRDGRSLGSNPTTREAETGRSLGYSPTTEGGRDRRSLGYSPTTEGGRDRKRTRVCQFAA